MSSLDDDKWRDFTTRISIKHSAFTAASSDFSATDQSFIGKASKGTSSATYSGARMVLRSKLEHLPVEEIVSAMVDINPAVEAWTSATLAKTGLWFTLARKFVSIVDKSYAYKLKLRFDRNRNNLKGLFGETVGAPFRKLDPPKLASTPKIHERICVCRRFYSPSDGSVIGCDKCDDWFHGNCIRTDVEIEGRKPTWTCPPCRGNDRFEYPETWLDSKSFQTDVISNVTSPPSDQKLQHTICSYESDNNASPSQKEQNVKVLEGSVNARINRPLLDDGVVVGARRKLDFDKTNDSLCCFVPNESTLEKPIPPVPSFEDTTDMELPLEKNFSYKQNASMADDKSLPLLDTVLGKTSDSKSLSRRKPSMVFTEVSCMDSRKPTFDFKRPKLDRIEEESNEVPLTEHETSAEIDASQGNFSDEDCKEVDEYMAGKGIQKPPSRFCFDISREEWEKNLECKNPPELKDGWGNIFRDAVKNYNRLCPFSFKSHDFLKGRLGYFFKARGYCKHGRTIKSASKKPCWTIDIFGLNPTDERTITFRAVCEGTFRHKSGNRERNFVTASKRDEIKQLLRHRKAGKLCADLNRNANIDEIRCGNANSLHGTKLLAQIRHEELAKKDLDKDAFIDLYKRMLTDKQLNAYVRAAGVKPLFIVMMSDDQLSLLKRMRKIVKPLVAHLDATGSIVKKLPLEDTNIFLYAVVVSSPTKGEPPLPIGEFLLSNQTRGSISLALNNFLRICQAYCNLPSSEPVFHRFETDDSAAMYGAVIEQTTHCKDVPEYLDHCWKELFMNKTPIKCNSHLCRAHAIKMLMVQGRKPVYLLGKSGMDTLYPLLSSYLKSRTMNEVIFYMRQVLFLCLSQHLNPEVLAIRRNIRSPMPASFVASYDWKNYVNPTANETGSIWSSTAFGRLFIHIKGEVLSAINSFPAVNVESNEIYSPLYVTYLQKEVLAYTPLFTHVMMAIRGDKSTVDTNDRVERWNREVKIVEGVRNEKMSRYVSDNHDTIEGRCVRIEASLDVFETVKRRLERLTHSSPIPSKIQTPRVPSRRKIPNRFIQRTTRVGKTPKICNSPVLIRNISKAQTPRVSQSPLVPSFLNTSPDQKTYLQKEQWCRKGTAVANRSGGIRHFQNLPVLKWGHEAMDSCCKVFTNTCTLDNFFMILIYAHHNSLTWREFLRNPRNQLMETFKTLVDLLVEPSPRINAARWHFIRSIQNRNPLEYKVDLRGDEHSSTLDLLQHLSTDYTVERQCQTHGSNGTEALKVFGQCNKDVMTSVQLINSGGLEIRCPICSEFMENVLDKPPTNVILPIIAFGVLYQMKLRDVPTHVEILGDDYDLFACSVFERAKAPCIGHYRTGFYFENKWYCFDAIGGRVTATAPSYDQVSTCWYKRRD